MKNIDFSALVTLCLYMIDSFLMEKKIQGGEYNVGISGKDGMAFRTKERLALNSFYDTQVVLWTKESFDTVIEIVRMENFGEEETLYGCRFVGISAADQFKIDVYQIVSEN